MAKSKTTPKGKKKAHHGLAIAERKRKAERRKEGDYAAAHPNLLGDVGYMRRSTGHHGPVRPKLQDALDKRLRRVAPGTGSHGDFEYEYPRKGGLTNKIAYPSSPTPLFNLSHPRKGTITALTSHKHGLACLNKAGQLVCGRG